MKVVIFGERNFASLAWYVLTHDSPHQVVGFAVDRSYRKADRLHDLPVIDFEAMRERFSPGDCSLLIPMGWAGMNAVRAHRYAQGKAWGYTFATYVSSRALVWPDLQAGENCMIFEGANIQPFARVGNNCIVRSGSVVSHHVRVGDHCFIAGQATIGGSATVGERCVIGLNSTVRDGVSVARGCFVAAGAVVVADTEEHGLYMGVPATRQVRPPDEL